MVYPRDRGGNLVFGAKGCVSSGRMVVKVILPPRVRRPIGGSVCAACGVAKVKVTQKESEVTRVMSFCDLLIYYLIYIL
jgi:hypothetical protein